MFQLKICYALNMQSIVVNFKPSFSLITIFVCAGLFALIIPAWLFFDGAIKNHAIILPLGLLIIFATSYAVCCHGLLVLPWSCVGLTIQVDKMVIKRRDGTLFKVTVLPSTTVNVHLTVLSLMRLCEPVNQTSKKPMSKELMARFNRLIKQVFLARYHIVLMQDKVMNDDSYRQLRVWLRFAAIAQEHRKKAFKIK